MQWVDSYLSEVSRFLPAETRDDILGELRASIEEQVIEHARARGSEPDASDEKAVLSEFGHPLKVASGYGEQQYLVGPGIYPAFVQTLRLLLILVLSLQVVVALIASVTAGNTLSISGLLSNTLETALLVTGIVVASFVLLERSGERLNWYDRWQPGTLRPGSVALTDRGDVITNLVTEGVFLLWWNGALAFPDVLTAIGGPEIVATSIWSELYWPINLVVAGWFVTHITVLLRGLWTRPALFAEIAFCVAALVLVGLLLRQTALVTVSEEFLAEFSGNLQLTVRIAVLVIGGFIAWDLVAAVRRLRARPPA